MRSTEAIPEVFVQGVCHLEIDWGFDGFQGMNLVSQIGSKILLLLNGAGPVLAVFPSKTPGSNVTATRQNSLPLNAVG